MSRLLPLLLVAVVVVAGAACSGDDDSDVASPDDASGDDGTSPGPRFCDVYLEYLSDSTDQYLDRVDEAADDEEVSAYIDIMQSDAEITAVVAATLDLDDVARSRCQTEWTAGTQGAGNTAAAAQAFFDALVAGDRVGARNVASANAIAIFEPWEPLPENPDSGTPAIGDIDDRAFSIALDPATLAECQVEVGVVVACQIAE